MAHTLTDLNGVTTGLMTRSHPPVLPAMPLARETTTGPRRSAPSAAEPVTSAASRQASRWSKRATLGFVLLTCGGFWAAVALTIYLANR